jgi:hypothetical protein
MIQLRFLDLPIDLDASSSCSFGASAAPGGREYRLQLFSLP